MLWFVEEWVNFNVLRSRKRGCSPCAIAKQYLFCCYLLTSEQQSRSKYRSKQTTIRPNGPRTAQPASNTNTKLQAQHVNRRKLAWLSTPSRYQSASNNKRQARDWSRAFRHALTESQNVKQTFELFCQRAPNPRPAISTHASWST